VPGMTAGVEERHIISTARASAGRPSIVRRAWTTLSQFVSLHVFTSLTRRIIFLNLVALIVLVGGIIYLNQFREGLIDARVSSLVTQGQIIASAIAADATVDDTDSINVDPNKLLDLEAGQSLSPSDQSSESIDFAINPEQVAPILGRLISPTMTRARIYDRDGTLLVDSEHLYSRGQVLTFDLPPPEVPKQNWFQAAWQQFNAWLSSRGYPRYQELGAANGRGYQEVGAALNGSASDVVRVDDQGQLIVSVGIPIQRYRSVRGALLLSTQGGDIDAIVHAERLAIFRVFLVAAAVTVVLSILLASTIAVPLRRLADAANRVRHRVTARPEIPDFSNRRDEIGNLSQALREMTGALYKRIDGIESFAADVAHEIKNPLTSLRSAVETLPLAKTPVAQARLMAIIQHDVRRLDRLISDISDASRLDAELARNDATTIDLKALLKTVVSINRDVGAASGCTVRLDFADGENATYRVCGYDSRLGQVFNNLIDNARSFCRDGGTVRVAAARRDGCVEVMVEDDGPGIRADQFERIFERFYTDRGDHGAFGQNSGLGLAISKQIVEAHRGTIAAENRTVPGTDPTGPPRVLGARFIIRLPAA
jgi:two-component system, OmpR family, sensor histidine kinase ChvG